MTLNRFPDAVAALRRAGDLAPDQPEVAGAFAEALIAEADGQVGDGGARGAAQGPHARPDAVRRRAFCSPLTARNRAICRERYRVGRT